MNQAPVALQTSMLASLSSMTMIVRQVTTRQGRCLFCSLLPRQSRSVTYQSVSSRSDLAIPRSGLLEERIMGPTHEELVAIKPPPRPYSSALTPALLMRHKLREYYWRTSARYGSDIEKGHLGSHTLTADEVTLEVLMAAQAHMGHNTSLWNPMNSRYIFGARQGIHIISLEATASHLKRAARVVEGVAASGGIILFVGTRKGQAAAVIKAARLTGGCHLFSRWVPGTITNGQQILNQCEITPVDPQDRAIKGFEEEMKENVAVLKPDLVVCMNPVENRTMLRECAMHCIPTIGVIDTNADPTTVTYPIPANDDSVRCTNLIAGVLGKAGFKGKTSRLEAAKNPAAELPYEPTDLGEIAFEEKGLLSKKEKEDIATAEREKNQEQRARLGRDYRR